MLARMLWIPVCLTGVTVACGGPEAPDSSRTSGAYLDGALWPNEEVTVCWESGESEWTEEKQWVQESIEEQFNDRTPVTLSGWESCGEANIRIAVVDDTAHTKGLGRQLDQKSNGMVLNFEFEEWNQTCQRNRESCIRSIAVHEFGHALGLAHEHNRDDRPDDCTEERQGTTGDVNVGEFDGRSVMNYCNPRYNNGGELSQGDVETLKKAYDDIAES